MSKVHLSKSYAVLVGLEAFVGAKAAVKSGVERITNPKQAKAKREESQREKQRAVEKHQDRGRGTEALGKALHDVKLAALGGNETGEEDARGVEIATVRNSELQPEEFRAHETSHQTPTGNEREQSE